MIRKRRRLRNKAKRTNNENDWSNYRTVRNKCVGLVRTAKDEYYLDKQAAMLDFPSPSIKNWWKLLKNLSGIPSTNSVYPPLNIDGQIIENHVNKAN